jgi:hypothetical protein
MIVGYDRHVIGSNLDACNRDTKEFSNGTSDIGNQRVVWHREIDIEWKIQL